MLNVSTGGIVMNQYINEQAVLYINKLNKKREEQNVESTPEKQVQHPIKRAWLLSMLIRLISTMVSKH
jgi:hypothetical protein